MRVEGSYFYPHHPLFSPIIVRLSSIFPPAQGSYFPAACTPPLSGKDSKPGTALAATALAAN